MLLEVLTNIHYTLHNSTGLFTGGGCELFDR